MKGVMAIASGAVLVSPARDYGPGGIHSEKNVQAEAAFDLVHSCVFKGGDQLVFEPLVDGKAGRRTSTAKGGFAGAEVYSYAWPTSLARRTDIHRLARLCFSVKNDATQIRLPRSAFPRVSTTTG